MALDAPSDLAMVSAAELAEKAGVSKATISRLVRRLGYESYEEARLAARALRAGGALLWRADSTVESQPAAVAIDEHLRSESRILEQTFAGIDPAVLSEIAHALAAARRVRIAAFRNGHGPGTHARSVLSQTRHDVAMLLQPGQTLGEAAGDVRLGDVVIVFGLRRRVSRFSQFVQTLSENGADVVLVTDPSVREAPASARWTLVCAVETEQAADSYVAVHAVVRLMACEMMKVLSARGRRHLERIELAQAALGDLE